MRAVLVLPLALVGACFTKPDRPAAIADAPPFDSSTGGDSAGDASTECVVYSFEPAIDVCAPWAHGSGNSESESDGTNLVITPHPNNGNDGGCIGNDQMSLSEMGMVIEVIQVVSAPSGYTRFTLDDQNRYPRMEVTANMLNLGTLSTPAFASVPYVPATMRWWRLRLDRTRNKIIGEYSADATIWMNLGELSNPPGSFLVAIEAGVRTVEPSPGSAKIGSLQICP